VSWYAVNIFGQRGINNLLLGENNAADQTKMMQDQMNMAAVSMPQDSSKAFKAEREGLLLVDHQWALKTIEHDVMSQRGHVRVR
jgi:ER membrane protein complex subunit 3